MKKTVKIFAIIFAAVLALSLTGCDLEKKVSETLDKANSLIDHTAQQQDEILDHGLQQQDELLDHGTQQMNDLLDHAMQQQDELFEHGLQLQQEIIGGEKEKQLDYDAIIDSFVPDSLNTFRLSVGDIHKPSAAVWLNGSHGAVYSSDESVVTVTDLGKVTAVGEGSAYVIIVGGTKMYKCYRYDVTA